MNNPERADISPSRDATSAAASTRWHYATVFILSAAYYATREYIRDGLSAVITLGLFLLLLILVIAHADRRRPVTSTGGRVGRFVGLAATVMVAGILVHELFRRG